MGFLSHIPSKRPSRRMPGAGHAFPSSLWSLSILLIIPILSKHPGKFGSICPATWFLLTSLCQLAHIMRSFELTPAFLVYHCHSRQRCCQHEEKGLRLVSGYGNGMDRCLDVKYWGPLGAPTVVQPDRKQSAWCGGTIFCTVHSKKESQYETEVRDLLQIWDGWGGKLAAERVKKIHSVERAEQTTDGSQTL